MYIYKIYVYVYYIYVYTYNGIIYILTYKKISRKYKSSTIKLRNIWKILLYCLQRK